MKRLSYFSGSLSVFVSLCGCLQDMCLCISRKLPFFRNNKAHLMNKKKKKKQQKTNNQDKKTKQDKKKKHPTKLTSLRYFFFFFFFLRKWTFPHEVPLIISFCP